MWNRWDHKTEMTFLALRTIVFALVLNMQQLVAKLLCYIVLTRGQGVCLCKQSLCLFNLLHVLRIFNITANLLFASGGYDCACVFFFFFKPKISISFTFAICFCCVLHQDKGIWFACEDERLPSQPWRTSCRGAKTTWWVWKNAERLLCLALQWSSGRQTVIVCALLLWQPCDVMDFLWCSRTLGWCGGQ